MISKLDIMKFFSRYEDDIDFSDFSPDELHEIMYEYMEETEKPVTAEDFKRRYFEFYDDVKDKSLKKQDW